MTPVRIRLAEESQALAIAAFEAHRQGVAALLPAAEIEHVGATAVSGALTKGHVDLLVRVSERDFAEAPVGVQLVVAGSDSDGFFGPFRDALINDPALLAEYNDLKLQLDGLDYESYTARKGEFVERVLRHTKVHTQRSRAPRPAGSRPRPRA